MSEYSVQQLAELSGVSVRTLHYYDEIGLLRPARSMNGYRRYQQEEVDKLQQILLYRRMQVKLTDIKTILENDDFDALDTLETHLEKLQEQQRITDRLIQSVEKTIAHLKGEHTMTDKEKFEGFKQQLISDNEEKYGEEAREKYGSDAVDESNARLAGMSPEQWEKSQQLDKMFKEKLIGAFRSGSDASCAEAQEACSIHAEWLRMFWGKGKYNKQAHLGLAQTYLADERFREYLDEDTSEYFCEALRIYSKE